MKESQIAEAKLEHTYVKIGKYIYKMQVETLWMALDYKSWKDYFDFLSSRFNKGRTQLYGYIGTVKSLSPYVDDETLVDMGISKAKELKRAVDTTSKAPSEELLAKAKDTKISTQDFRDAVHKEFHIVDHNEPGIWRDFHGCYLTTDENSLINEAFDKARNIDPVIPNDLPAHVQFKEILIRLCQEFMSTANGEPEYDIDGFNEVFNSINEKA